MHDTPQEKALGQSNTVVGKMFMTERFMLRGIATGAAYADLDALGLAVSIDVPISGVIQSATYYDLDDEGLQVDLWLLNDKPTDQTDNSAVAFIDHDLIKVIPGGRLQFTAFADAANGQFSPLNTIGLAYVAPKRKLWIQAQARGALNIAAGNLPMFQLCILSDE